MARRYRSRKFHPGPKSTPARRVVRLGCEHEWRFSTTLPLVGLAVHRCQRCDERSYTQVAS